MDALNSSLKLWAHKELTLAVRKKLIVKPDACQKCGKQSKLCAHHHDYKLPLNVEWLCYSCHNKQHPERSVKFIAAAIDRPSPKMKVAVEWLKGHPEHMETESRVLADLIGVSHTLANEAKRRILSTNGHSNGNGAHS